MMSKLNNYLKIYSEKFEVVIQKILDEILMYPKYFLNRL